jgi:hypothetical protein
MYPETARQILQAMQNHRQPGRTRAARVMDAMLHAQQSKRKSPGYDRGLNIHLDRNRYDELHANYRPSPRYPHLP